MTDATTAGDATGGEKTKVDVKGGAQYHCDFCRKDITNVVRIKCAACEDFDLCLECFAQGVYVKPHQPNHPYRVVNNVKTPLYVDDWGADEELMLLEAIEMFGMGNWSDVAEHVGTKNKTQCETHYDEVYLNSATAPLPDSTKALTRRTATTNAATRAKKEEPDMMDIDSTGVKTEPNTATTTTAASSSTTTATPAIPPKPLPRAHGVTKPKPKSGLGHLVGYIPNRGDFDTEWENDAELTLADMEFKEEDTKWERDLKLKVLEIYNSKLDARIERKKFILDRGLLERKEKKRSKEEREVYNNMRVFARFHSAEEHEAFIQGLLNEQRLRKKIEQLQSYRLNGIRTLADGELYEIEKRKRETQSGKAKSSLGAGAWGEPPGSGAASSAAAAANKGKKRTADAATLGEDGGVGKKGKGPEGKTVIPPTNPEWDVSKMPGHELLSAQEKLLCTSLQLLPQHYLMIKERLIRECFTRGFLKENSAKQLIKIDVNKTSKIFDFFVSVGWLNTGDIIKAQTTGNSATTASTSNAASKKPAATTGSASGAPRSGSVKTQ